MIGLGVLLNRFSDDSATVDAVKAVIGQRIAKAETVNDTLRLTTAGGTLILSDDGQSCCESRYMTCDDDLSSFVGDEIRDIDVREAPSQTKPDDYGEHEVQFLVVTTTGGAITVATHNEHNGYYGGFSIAAKFEETL